VADRRWLAALWWLGGLFLVQGLGGAARAQALPTPPAASELVLEAEFLAWRDARAAVRVGVSRDWRPIDVLDEQGRYTGLSGDLLRTLAGMLGLRTEVRGFGDYSELMAAARRGEIDLLPSMARSPQREGELLFTDSYVELPVAYVGRRGVTDFSVEHGFGGRRVAVERGSPVHELLRTRYPDAELLVVSDTATALKAVSIGEADVYLGALPPTHHAVEALRLDNLEVLETTTSELGRLHFAVSPAAAPLRDALDAALRRLDPQWLAQLAAAWQPRYLLLSPQRASGEALSPAQRAEVARLGELRVGFDQGFSPINAVGADGQPAGFAIELFRRAAGHAGVRYRFEPQSTFAAGLEAVRQGRLDVMLSAVRTDDRLQFARFVGPYYSAPSVLVTRLEDGWSTLEALAGRTLAIDRAHYLIPAIRREMPSVQVREVDSVEAALEEVAQRRAEAMITNLEVAASYINRSYLGQLQVSGTVPGRPSELYFMVRQDLPLVAQALRAGLDAIPENERAMLANAWLRVQYRSGLDWRDIAVVVGPGLLLLVAVLAFSLFYNARLQALVRARRQAERMLQLERDAARAATAAKADFLAEMGHEIRTPVSAIAGGLELLQREPLPAHARDLVRAIGRAADRLVELLNNLLDMAKLEAHKIALHPAPTDLGALVRDLAEEFAPAARAKQVALVARGTEHWRRPVMADAMRVRQVLGNLLSNAIKFTAHGSVEVRMLPPEHVSDGVRKLVLQVQDTGRGMSADVTARLFTRFEQAPGTATHYGGTGLGLTIVRELLGLMGGQVSVHSVPGQGSCFTVEIPLVLAPSAGEPGAAARRPVARLLLVEDGEVNQLLYAEQLRQRGFDTAVCSSAEAAYELLEREPADLVITDIHLPGMSGQQFALALRGRWPDLAVVAFTAEDDPDLHAAWAADFEMVLDKPQRVDDTHWIDMLCERFEPAPRSPAATAPRAAVSVWGELDAAAG